MGEEAPYVRFYDFDADFDHDLRFYSDLARGRRVLELACGSGRLLGALSQQARELVGLDLDPAMLARAASSHQIELVAGDLRHFDLGRRFDLILLAANGLCLAATAEGQRTCLDAVRSHLVEGGLFSFDLPNPAPFLARRQPFERELHLYTRTNPQTGLATARYTTHHHDAFHQLIIGDTRYVEYHPDGSTRQYCCREVLRYVHPHELELMLERAGLELVSRHSWFDQRPMGPDAAKQVIVARATGPGSD